MLLTYRSSCSMGRYSLRVTAAATPIASARAAAAIAAIWSVSREIPARATAYGLRPMKIQPSASGLVNVIAKRSPSLVTIAEPESSRDASAMR